MERLQGDIPQIFCKLERIFPHGFFDSMEHLPVHLPYEAKIAGPIQYRWMYPFESKKKDKDDWVAVLNIKPRNVVELPDEEIEIAAELNILFQVEEVQVYEIDMNVATDESIHLHNANGGLIEMDEVTDDGLLQEHHDNQEDTTEEEYETEETEEDEEEDLEEDTDRN
ncbi:hypothetical protein P3S67_012593 [Capsicum chacoense]